MIKRTLYFENPVKLTTTNDQLCINRKNEEDITIPIEEIGIVILDNIQITISNQVINKLNQNNCALITCDESHHPNGMLLNLNGNTLQSSKFSAQLAASLPLKKQLWQQTISCKIANQASLLKNIRQNCKPLINWSKCVKSGDSDNHEALAAAYYWKRIFPEFLEFKRSRFGPPPNNLLNYGYSILRALIARSLVGSGLLPTCGIFHRNQYNAYCLADDIMEPYRPFVDLIVYKIVTMHGNFLDMTPSMKKLLLEIPVIDVIIKGEKSPLSIAAQRTTSSLAKCFEGESRKIEYPEFE